MRYKSIELVPKMDFDDDKIVETLWHFLVALVRNGQIINSYKIIKKSNYTLYVTTPKNDSLNEYYDNFYVTADRKTILKYFDMVINDLGEDIESQSYCGCKYRSAIEMQTYAYDIDSAFTCCNCGKPIALYELTNIEDDYYKVQEWQENYAAMDKLWLNGLCDRYTGNQLVNTDSALNQQGLAIARNMRDSEGGTVYYHLSCQYGNKVKTEKSGNEEIHICPKCQKLMTRVEFAEDYKRDVCKSCGLSYDAHQCPDA